jgi:glutamate-1-semialdehyde 2,1-aminomutase
MLREETRKISALLIFDEVISGFRVGLQGAQGLYGITPDLSCFGKVVGGGFPVAAFGGRKEIMNHLAPLGQVYQAGTLSGNPVAMCAGLQTLLEIEKPGFYEELQDKTDRLTKPIQEELKKSNFPALLQQVGSMFTLFFGVTKVSSKEDLQKMDQTLYKRFFVHLFEKGIYFPPSPYETCFVSQAHTEENLEKTKEAVLEFIR